MCIMVKVDYTCCYMLQKLELLLIVINVLGDKFKYLASTLLSVATLVVTFTLL